MQQRRLPRSRRGHHHLHTTRMQTRIKALDQLRSQLISAEKPLGLLTSERG
jgi:hypothetical protein